MKHAHEEFRTDLHEIYFEPDYSIEPHSSFALMAAYARFIAQLLLARLLEL